MSANLDAELKASKPLSDSIVGAPKDGEKESPTVEQKDAEEKRNFDHTRSLRIIDLPSSLNDDTEGAVGEVVLEIVESALNVDAVEWVESVAKLPANTTSADEESQAQALVQFCSRIHRHRAYSQRAKLEKPFQLLPVTEAEILEFGFSASCSKSAFAVSSEKAETEVIISSTAEAGKDGQVSKVVEQMTIEEDVAAQQKVSGASVSESAGNSRFRVQWDGAPEFQWRIPESPEDAYKIVVENVSLGDVDIVWLYQAMSRCRNVQFNFNKTFSRGTFGNSMFSRGDVILTFTSDVAAMSQAINGMVCIRTRPNRRLKIYLPQTENTMKMRATLELKLGRAYTPNERSSQLLVRNVCTDYGPKELRDMFSRIEPADIVDVDMRQDKLQRRCAVIKFKSPEAAIWAHLKHDVIDCGKDAAATYVYYMQDIVEDSLLMKTEVKMLETNPMLLKRAATGPVDELADVANKRMSDGPSPMLQSRMRFEAPNRFPPRFRPPPPPALRAGGFPLVRQRVPLPPPLPRGPVGMGAAPFGFPRLPYNGPTTAGGPPAAGPPRFSVPPPALPPPTQAFGQQQQQPQQQQQQSNLSSGPSTEQALALLQKHLSETAGGGDINPQELQMKSRIDKQQNLIRELANELKRYKEERSNLAAAAGAASAAVWNGGGPSNQPLAGDNGPSSAPTTYGRPFAGHGVAQPPYSAGANYGMW